jgi:polyhydroxyalkanoate synthesis regulator phasin
MATKTKTTTTKDILKMYEHGKSHSEISQYLVDRGEMDDYTEATKVVQEVILICRRMKK